MNKQTPQNYPKHPQHLWGLFYQISQIPRPSKKEEKVVKWLEDLAKQNSFEYKIDEVNNVIIYVPGSKGRENEQPVLIQNHTDMVCDKVPGHVFDFDNDPIQILVENNFVKADKTTLGADNGVGVAAALAVALDESVSHPPLELLFTSDEETGLNGAQNINPDDFRSKRMLNLDTEEWGSLYIGCAGGIDYELNSSFTMKKANDKFGSFEIKVLSLNGGHSGIDIHRGRGNAIKILTQILQGMPVEYELAEFQGGAAHNIIPRDAFAKVQFSQDSIEKVQEYISESYEKIVGHLPEEDQDFEIEVSKAEIQNVLENKDQFINLMSLFPHGAYSYNWQTEEPLVNYSSNLAVVRLMEGKFYCLTSVRFTDPNEHQELENKLQSLASVFGLDLVKNTGYPSWKPVLKNPLLDKVKDVYEKTFSEKPQIKAIHAGLECGLLKDALGEIDIVSFGPTIHGAHSPSERIEIESTEKFWKLLVEVLKAI